jgi:hypothetical protein
MKRFRSSLRLTDFSQLATLAPMDRTAAVVAGGADHDDVLSAEDARENRRRPLISLRGQAERLISKTHDHEKRKHLGKRVLRIQTELSLLNGEIRQARQQQPPASPAVTKKPGLKTDLRHQFMQVVQEQTDVATFQAFLAEARRAGGWWDRCTGRATTPCPYTGADAGRVSGSASGYAGAGCRAMGKRRCRSRKTCKAGDPR